VALRYRKEETPAPKVIAKDKEYMPENIRKFAREYGISLVEDKSLARPLKVPVECVITSDLYRALARDTGVL
jgi:flagellar biosynthetic protein FlhB